MRSRVNRLLAVDVARDRSRTLSSRATATLQTHFAKAGYDLVGAASKQLGRMRVAPDPDDKAEIAGSGCSDACCRVLEYHGANWRSAETARGFQKHVRSGLPAHTEAIKIDTIDPRIEECRQTSNPQDFCAMVTG